MATKTSLLGLTKPAYTDAGDVQILNNNFDILENAIGARSRFLSLLDNAYFPEALNRRDITTTTAWAECLERWISRTTGIEIAIDTNGLHIASSATGNIYLYQKIKIPSAQMLGKTYTIAICNGDGNIACKSITLPATEPTTWTTLATASAGNVFTNIIHTGSGENGFCVSVGRSTTETNEVVIRWALLLPGTYTEDTLPAFVPREKTVEYLECSRYLYKSPPASNIQGSGIVSSTLTRALIAVVLPVPMRVTPSISVISRGQIQCGGVVRDVTGITVNRMDENVVLLSVTVGADLPANHTAALVNASFELTAKL